MQVDSLPRVQKSLAPAPVARRRKQGLLELFLMLIILKKQNCPLLKKEGKNVGEGIANKCSKGKCPLVFSSLYEYNYAPDVT